MLIDFLSAIPFLTCPLQLITASVPRPCGPHIWFGFSAGYSAFPHFLSAFVHPVVFQSFLLCIPAAHSASACHRNQPTNHNGTAPKYVPHTHSFGSVPLLFWLYLCSIDHCSRFSPAHLHVPQLCFGHSVCFLVLRPGVFLASALCSFFYHHRTLPRKWSDAFSACHIIGLCILPCGHFAFCSLPHSQADTHTLSNSSHHACQPPCLRIVWTIFRSPQLDFIDSNNLCIHHPLVFCFLPTAFRWFTRCLSVVLSALPCPVLAHMPFRTPHSHEIPHYFPFPTHSHAHFFRFFSFDFVLPTQPFLGSCCSLLLRRCHRNFF